MTGAELSAACGLDLRDVGATNYRQHERLAYLKRALRSLALDLARRQSHLVQSEVVSGSPQWPAEVTPGAAGLDLPANYITMVAVYLDGLENSQGPLAKATVNLRYTQGTAPGGYYIQAKRLYLVPAPAEALTVRLVYNAWPDLVRAAPVLVAGGDTATADAAAALQLAGELPWSGIFDEALRAFVTQACANRNEYDTQVELGLYQMLLTMAHEAAGMDTMADFSPDPGIEPFYDFSGR